MYTMYCAIDHTVDEERYYLHLLPEEIVGQLRKAKRKSTTINIEFRENKLITKKFTGKRSEILAGIKDWLGDITNSEIESVLKEPIEAAYRITSYLEKNSTIEVLWDSQEDYRHVNRIIDANCNEIVPTEGDLDFLRKLLKKVDQAIIDKRLVELEKALRAGVIEYYPLDEYRVVN